MDETQFFCLTFLLWGGEMIFVLRILSAEGGARNWCAQGQIPLGGRVVVSGRLPLSVYETCMHRALLVV